MDRQLYQEQTQENCSQLNSEITALDSFYREKKFKDFWQQVKIIRELFKTLKPLAREDREPLWQKFLDLQNKAKADIQEREQTSSVEKHKILSQILLMTGTGSPGPINLLGTRNDVLAESGGINEQINSARQQLSFVLEKMKSLGPELTRADRQECWEAYVKAGEQLHSMRQLLNEQDYNILLEDVNSVWNAAASKDNPHETLAEIKELQQAVRAAILNKDQRQDIRDKLNKIWEEAISRLGAVKAEKCRRHEEWRQKQEDWIGHQQTRAENKEEFIERLEQQISDLEDQIAQSRHDDWIDKAQGWVRERQNKIEEVREEIREIEQKIAEAQSRLDHDD